MNPPPVIRGLAALVCGCAVATSVMRTAAAITIETVLIGHPGNLDDIAYSSAGAFGSVGYAYEIGKYEVTNDQYVEFLNAVAASDFNGLYQSEMTNNSKGGIIRNGSPGGFSYEVKPDMGNKPVISVNLWDAARFVNWLHNGQPTGGQTDDTTEDGVYDLDGQAPSSTVNWERQPGATWFIPTEDEWYKAAYYDPRSESQGGPPGDDHYWLYPTQSDAAPTAGTATATGDIANPGPNVANYDNAAWNGIDYHLTSVGSAGPASASYWGTHDQAGNIAELTETPFQLDPFFVSRGGGTGSMYSASRPNKVSATQRGSFDPAVDQPGLGFRVAKLAETIVVPLGDYNGDGVVNLADYNVWRDSLGASVVLPGDATPGMVDASDYGVWKTHFGQSTTALATITPAAVPEPRTSAMLATVCVMFLGTLGYHRYLSVPSTRK